MKCEDIKQFTSVSEYNVNVSMVDLIRTIDNDIHVFNLQLNPDFQRGHVWTKEQQIAFVEYFLRGGKSGTTIYLNNPDWGGNHKGDYHDFVCVDGLQRITAVRRFLNNEIPVFGGNYYKDFEDDYIFKYDVFHMFTINVNNLKSKEEVLSWYIEMNAGGTPHTKKEIEKVRKLLIDEQNKGNPNYTGHMDSLGNPIFVGDVVKEGCNGLVAEVEFNKERGAYHLKGLGEGYGIEDSEIEWEVVATKQQMTNMLALDDEELFARMDEIEDILKHGKLKLKDRLPMIKEQDALLYEADRRGWKKVSNPELSNTNSCEVER